jgi:pyrimidine-specific ribonucleoside hydrolase
MRKPVIIDCDPGHDDAIALLLACANPSLEVKGVTVVAGNQILSKTLQNTLNVLSYAGIEVEVAKGADKPLLRDLLIAPEVHGDSGLDGPKFPGATLGASNRSALELMEHVLTNSQEKVTLIPTGPLTNIAHLLMTYPELKNKIERISLMGGACFGGNWTPSAEFNILVDPEAAGVVFKSGVPITMSGLDVTHKALFYEEDVETVRSMGKKVSSMVVELLDFYYKFYRKMGFDGMPLHDPCAVAYVINPEIFTTKKCHVDIETRGEFTQGATVVDICDVWKKSKNVDVALDIDRKAFCQMIFEAINTYV